MIFLAITLIPVFPEPEESDHYENVWQPKSFDRYEPVFICQTDEKWCRILIDSSAKTMLVDPDDIELRGIHPWRG